MAIRALSALRGTPRRWSRPGCSPPWGPGLPGRDGPVQGQQPSAWTEMSRGRRSMSPAALRSLSPFQAPAMVQPSPTDRAM
jgi:hypothetical protein